MTATRALVEAGTERLRAAGSDTPRLDAELLLAHAIGVERTAVVAHGEAPVGADAEAHVPRAAGRRAAGEPVAYIRGIKEFHGIALAVDPRALIPRPETERSWTRRRPRSMRGLTSGAARTGAGCRVVDVGTGSGAVASPSRSRCGPARAGRGRDDHGGRCLAPRPSTWPARTPSGTASATGCRSRPRTCCHPDRVRIPCDVVLANLPYVRSDELDASAGTP